MDIIELTNKIKDLWAGLMQNAQRTMRSIDSSNPTIMLMASHDTLSFLIRVNRANRNIPKKEKLANLSIDVVDVTNQEKAILVTLESVKFKATFTTIAADVIYNTLGKQTEAERLNAFMSRLNLWRNVFSRGHNTLLSKEEQVGLYGEVSFINDLLDYSDLTPTEIIDAWKGPAQEAKDFQVNNIAVEIKTTTNNNGITKISNLNQLDETGLDHLYLYHYAFARTDGGANTLPRLIDDLRNALSATAAFDAFQEKLIMVGYLDSDKESYTYSYAKMTDQGYIVEGQFPRLSTASVMQGVTDASYSIDLNCCSNYVVNQADIFDNLKQ